MKVYIITKGDYSDYRIEAVTLDKNVARLLKAYYSDRWDEAIIEEYVLANGCPALNRSRNRWSITIKEDGSIVNIYQYVGDDDEQAVSDMYDGSYIIYTSAKDQDHAIKIARDIIAKVKWQKLEMSEGE